MFRFTIAIAVILALLLPATPRAAERAGESIYRLTGDALFVEDCSAPCLCPIFQQQAMRGVFMLGRARPGNAVDFHRVAELNWRVGEADAVHHTISGTGTYRVTNYGEPRSHALDLSLSIDGGAPQNFFSDFVELGPDGRIDLPLQAAQTSCPQLSLRVSAAPLPPARAIPYRLSADSRFQQGCFDPCDCPLEEPRPLAGRFLLVPVADFGTVAEFALMRARFALPDPATPDMLRGAGWYTLIQGFAGPIQAMDLRLRIDGEPAVAFDSELANTDPVFPRINIVLDMNEMVCFDQVLSLEAAPAQ